jgi:hypothetical protein
MRFAVSVLVTITRMAIMVNLARIVNHKLLEASIISKSLRLKGFRAQLGLRISFIVPTLSSHFQQTVPLGSACKGSECVIW